MTSASRPWVIPPGDVREWLERARGSRSRMLAELNDAPARREYIGEWVTSEPKKVLVPRPVTAYKPDGEYKVEVFVEPATAERPEGAVIFRQGDPAPKGVPVEDVMPATRGIPVDDILPTIRENLVQHEKQVQRG